MHPPRVFLTKKHDVSSFLWLRLICSPTTPPPKKKEKKEEEEEEEKKINITSKQN